jgi:hypothetical protein
VTVGLGIFLEGVKFGLMPLGEVIGKTLPVRAPRWVTFLVVFTMGVGVTFAEPAIQALQQVGKGVQVEVSPYLYFLLNDWSTYLVLAVGIGVGFAAVVGTCRFLYKWSMKPVIYATVSVVLLTTIVVVYLAPDQLGEQLIGLAWDCGAVTTGPVTVPVILALGLGIVACADGEDDEGGEGGARAGTGASECFDAAGPELEDEAAAAAAGADAYLNSGGLSAGALGQAFAGAEDESPDRGITLDVEAGMGEADEPALVTPAGSTASGMRTPSSVSRASRASRAALSRASEASVLEAGDELEGFGIVTLASLFPVMSVFVLGFVLHSTYTVAEILAIVANAAADDDGAPEDPDETIFDQTPFKQIVATSQAVLPLVAFLLLILFCMKQRVPLIKACVESESGGLIQREVSLFAGLACSFAGLVIFNIGLTYGLIKLGQAVGTNLPVAFETLNDPDGVGEPRAALYGYDAGLALALVFVTCLGFCATLAEPALSQLGRTVETLSKGAFSKNALTRSVAVGVAIGMVTGVLKVLFGFTMLNIQIVAYGVAVCLTALSPEEVVCIAWDSAGVTTGEVTVPLVLALGTGISSVISEPSLEGGFGILTLSSVGPIIAVMATRLLLNKGK